MKNFAFLAFILLLFSACQKEDITPAIFDSSDGITRLYVNVSFNDCYSGQNCDASSSIPVYNADVYLYEKKEGVVDGEGAVLHDLTNGGGIAKFENMESKKYVLEVNCQQGNSEQEVYIEAGKTTKVNIKY